MPGHENKSPAPSWAGYVFAIVTTAVLYFLQLEVERWLGVRISLPLCGLAAVLACIWRAGVRPALLATLLTTAWYVQDSGIAGPYSWIHYGLYVTEAGIVCFYGRELGAARDQAAQGEDWQRHLVETSGEGIWMVGPDSVISYANPRIAEILGCTAEEITGQKVEQFLFAEDVPAERIRFQNRRPGVKEQYDRRLRRADGSEVWTLACSSSYAYREKDAGVLTMMTDITERKKAEQALRRSERKFRELFENIREGVYQTSPDGRILAANPELLRMLGFSSQEELNVVGVVKDTFVDTELHHSLRDRLERDGSYANVEFQLRTRDNRIVTVSENARVVRDENGNVLYYEGTLTDVTEKLRFEKQLREAQKMEALGRLAGGIARDFRAIGDNMFHTLQQARTVLPNDSPAQVLLDSVARSMSSSDALTRQILDFSQRQRGSRDEKDRLIYLNDLIRSMEPSLYGLAGENTALELSLCPEPTPVLVDPANLEQILISLLIHISDSGANRVVIATLLQSGGVSLTVRAESIDDTARWIGMATLQAILVQYGGTLAAVPETDGRSIRYILYLPLTGGILSPAARAGKQIADPRAVTILLMEEEPLIRELSRDTLEFQGFRVLTACSAAEAERTVRGLVGFCVLITEWRENGANDLAQSFRAIQPELCVLFIAGYSDQTPDSVSLPPRAAVLQKPFSGDSLGRKIRELVGRYGAIGI